MDEDLVSCSDLNNITNNCSLQPIIKLEIIDLDNSDVVQIGQNGLEKMVGIKEEYPSDSEEIFEEMTIEYDQTPKQVLNIKQEVETNYSSTVAVTSKVGLREKSKSGKNHKRIEQTGGQAIIKLHKCKLCGKEYKYKSHLINHEMKNVNGERTCQEIKESNEKISRFGSSSTNHSEILPEGIRLRIKKAKLLPDSSEPVRKRSNKEKTPNKCSNRDHPESSPEGIQTNRKEQLAPESKEKTRNSCSICSKTLSSISSLKRHVKTIHNNEGPSSKKRHKCSFCEKVFTQKFYLNLHISSVHFRLKPHKCSICKKSFSRNKHLKEHLKTIHNGLKPHICSICQKSYSRIFGLTQHLKSAHKPTTDHSPPAGTTLLGEELHLQQKPAAGYSPLQALHSVSSRAEPHSLHIVDNHHASYLEDAQEKRLHVNTDAHSSNNKELGLYSSASICEKNSDKFGDSYSYLQNHSTETEVPGSKQIIVSNKCRVCCKTFSHKSYLRHHVRYTHGEKLHKCRICSKTFSFFSNLKSHVNFHAQLTGEVIIPEDIMQFNNSEQDDATGEDVLFLSYDRLLCKSTSGTSVQRQQLQPTED